MALAADKVGGRSADLNPDPAGFGVYVHWPFCAAKCPYCDFNSHVRHGGVDQKYYLEAYLSEIKATRTLTGPRSTSSVFFGGGTPSLMESSTVAAIVDAIDHAWPIEADAEITLEANPTSVDASRFGGYRAAGVNRVSLGVQSLSDDDLRRLGRLHSAAEARLAIETAADTFERHSFDLIYARPGQTEVEWERELGAALAIGVRHLSLYQLAIEPETPFAELYNKGRLTLPHAAQAETMFRITRDMTTAAGMPAYETSNHAMPGEESRHNLLYWRYGEYAGIGPGAHGRLIVDDVRTAVSIERMPERWRERTVHDGDAIVEWEALDRAAQADELLMMSLRLAEGLDLARLASIGGVVPAVEVIDALVGEGLLLHDRKSSNRGRLQASARGAFVLNEIVLQLSEAFVDARPSSRI